MKKLVESLGALNPFGAVSIIPPVQILGHAERFFLSQKDAKILYRQLGTAIKQHQKAQAKFVRSMIKINPWKGILRGGKFPQVNEIRGVK